MDSQTGAQEKKNFSWIVKLLTPKFIITFAILILLIIGAIGLRSVLSSDRKTTKIGFENIGELITQAAYTTQVNVTDASRELWGIQIPFTQSKYIYSYDVIIKAGFNFSEIQWSVDDENLQINVTLPEAKVMSNQIIPNSFKIYHESESIFRQISLEENNAALAALAENAEKDAISNGLLDNARTNAQTILNAFFGNHYDLDKYKIVYSDK